MSDNPAHVTQNFITESLPQSREQLVFRCYMAVIKADENKNIMHKIGAIKTFITAALPDIKKDYDPLTPHKIEPTFLQVQKDYLARNPILVEELIYSRYPEIEAERKLRYLNLLEAEFSRVMILLSNNTNWAFTKSEVKNVG